jgi:hypothetical protein
MEFLATVRKKRAIILPVGLDVKEGDVVKCSCEVVKRREEEREE